MTPEKLLLARVFASLSTGSTSPRDHSDRLSVLTLLAFKVQLLFSTCLSWVQEHASGLLRVPGVDASDEQDREGGSESDHAATVARVPARKQNARAETKWKW